MLGKPSLGPELKQAPVGASSFRVRKGPNVASAPRRAASRRAFLQNGILPHRCQLNMAGYGRLLPQLLAKNPQILWLALPGKEAWHTFG